MEAADQMMARRGGWAVVLGRWVPGVPCDPLSYAAGIMRMPWSKFMLLTGVGLIPANLITAYLGAEATGDVGTRYWVLGLVVIAALSAAWKILDIQRRRRSARTGLLRRAHDRLAERRLGGAASALHRLAPFIRVDRREPRAHR